MKLEIHHHYYRHDDLGDVLKAIANLERNVMSAISDFAAKQAAHNAEVSADLDAISKKIDDQSTLIATLQTSAGTITPEDQATLDNLEASNEELQVKADALAGKTPPAPPTDATPTT